MVVNAFFENVNLHRMDGRGLAPTEELQNRLLEFRQTPMQDRARIQPHGPPV
jgi:hypothetical protein